LGIGDWAQSPIPNPQSPIPNPQIKKIIIFKNTIINNNCIYYNKIKFYILSIKINKNFININI